TQIHQRIGEHRLAIYGDRCNEIAVELAMHFEQSRDWPRALQYLLQAAENAVRRSAHHEAANLAGRGLEIIKSVPENAERDKQEMKLRMILGVSLMATKGFALAEVERLNAPGRELFWRYGPSPELFFMLWSLNMYRQFSGDMDSSLEISNQLLQMAAELKNEALIMQAHCSIASVLTLLGRCSEALTHIEKGEALYARNQNNSNAVFAGFDNQVMFDCFAALAFLTLGDSGQSSDKLSAGLALARDLGHPPTLVVAEHIAAQIHQLRGDAVRSYEFAKQATELADEYGLELWRAYGM